MAHTYKVEPKDRHVYVQTDNEDNLGEKPYFVWDIDGEGHEQEMEKEGNLYTIDRQGGIRPFYYYHIEYKDTGKVDKKNGGEYCYNPISMMQKASVATRLQHKQPLVHTLKEGKTVGKIKWESPHNYNNDDITEPTILVARTFHPQKDNNPNIVGLIFTSDNISCFSHHATRLRQETDVCGAVLDPNKIEELKSLDGKKVKLEIKDNKIHFEETDKPAKPIEYNRTIDVPKLKPCDRILTSKEYTSDVIGAKAVNLRRLEELQELGKIDVIIPKSMALPSGYLEPFAGTTKMEIDNYIRYWNECMDSGKLDNLINTLKDNGIDGKNGIMVRSAFNGEDLPNYSAAGIYRTFPSYLDPEALFECITSVVDSKFGSNAVYSRKMYNIPEENIQPGIILQERIEPDYKYTLYTDDKKGNLKIELYSDKKWRDEDAVQPNVFTYNRKTGELSYDSIQLAYPMVTFDENEKIVELEPLKYDLSDNKELFEQLKKVAKNALVVEKEFGNVPQDIEGGIKGNDIYFWQTRNIVY